MKAIRKLLIVRSIATEGGPIWQPFTNICKSRRIPIKAVGRIRGKLQPQDVAVMILDLEAPLAEHMLRRSVSVYGPEYMIIPFEKAHKYCVEWNEVTDAFADTVQAKVPSKELVHA